MNNYIGLIMGFAFLVLFVWQQIKFQKREDKLINRIMAKTYQEYQYFEREHEKEIAELEKIRAGEHKEKPEKEKMFIDGVETEVDMEKFDENWD